MFFNIQKFQQHQTRSFVILVKYLRKH